MPLRLVLVVATTSLAAAVPAAAIAQPTHAPLAAQAAKAKKCKGKKVPVTINGRRRCMKLKAALPKPKAADQRLLAAQAALGFDPGKVRDRRGRKAVSVAKLLGRARVKIAEKAVKQGLSTLDGLSAAASLSSTVGHSPLATASAKGCGAGPPGHPELTQSFGGNGFDATVALDKGAAQIGVDLGEGGVRAEIDFGLCEIGGSKLKIPECPDARGELEGSDEAQMFASIRIFKGGELVLSQKFDFSTDTEIKPIQVDDDAKLEYLEVEHSYRTSVVLGGSSQAFGQISFKMTYHGSTRVTFPGGEYDPTHTDVDVKLNIAGAAADELHEVRDVEFDESFKAKPEADKDFAAEVDKVIAKAREREQGWQQPNKCAEIKFEPASDSLHLKKDEHGSFKARVDSKKGGSPESAKWTRLDVENATVDPGNALANPTSFNYTVTRAGRDLKVKAKFKAVSRTGVAEAEWTQPTEQGIDHISGTFTQREDESGSIFEWTAKVEFDRSTEAFMGGSDGQYKLAPANYTVTASGNGGYFSPALSSCSMSGSGTFALSPADSGFFALPRLTETDPYKYTFTIQPAAGAELTYPIAITCPNPEDSTSTEWFGSFTASPLALQDSADGIDFSGSETIEEEFSPTKTLEWSFHGTE